MDAASPPAAPSPQPHSGHEQHSHVYGEGRAKLLAAAATLAARHGHLGFSLRELAREAGLGHNTIYRHFDSVEAMMPALVEGFYQELRQGLSEARRRIPPGTLPSRTVLPWLLDFAAAHRDTFLISMRERYRLTDTPAPWVEQGLSDIHADMLKDLAELGQIPSPVPEQVRVATRMLIDQSFQICLEYLRHPDRKNEILIRAEQGYRWIMGGALMDAGIVGSHDQP